MTWTPRPLPDVNPETEPYWTAAADDQLLVRACTACGLVYWYPRSHCPDCFSDAVEWQEATGTGEIYSYSVSEQVGGWPDHALPVIIAYVELEEGPRMMTNIVDCDPADVEIGLPVEVVFEPAEDGDIAIPVFTPA